MSIIEQCKSFLFIFYLIGIAPLHSGSVNEKTNSKRYLVPATISSIIILSVTVFFAYSSSVDVDTLGRFSMIVNCFSLLSASWFSLTSIFQCCYYPSTYQALINRINKIQTNLEDKLPEIGPIAAFPRTYKRKISFLFFFLFVSTISGSTLLWNLLGISGAVIAISQAWLSAFSGLVVAHCILYVDTVQLFFRVLNLQIENSAASLRSSKKIEFLKYVKSMHLDLWILVNQINGFFSWTLLSFNINYMIYVVFDLYLILPMLQADWDILGITACFFALLYDATSLTLLTNACHFCTGEASNLIESVEDFTFWTDSDYQLHQLKHEMFSQINNLDISFEVSGFFINNREHLAGVQVVATCCTYMIICMQFFLAEK